MNSSPALPRPSSLPSAEPVPEVTPPQAEPPRPAPLDLLIVTSRADFHWEAEQLLGHAERYGILAETLFVEDLVGTNAGEQLHDLHRRIGELCASGRLSSGSTVCISLHGRLSRHYSSPQDLHERRPDLHQFVVTLGVTAQSITPAGDTALAASSEDKEAFTASDAEDESAQLSATDDGDVSDDDLASEDAASAESSSESCDSRTDSEDEAGDNPDIHCLTVNNRKQDFPTDLFCLALRQARRTDGQWHPGYAGPILLTACYGGTVRDTLKDHGADYLILNGTKPGWIDDGTDCCCMLEAIEIMAEHKRTQCEPPTAHQYWNRIRQVSGEHVAWVRGDRIDVHKVLAHDEPVLVTSGGRAAGQPVRALKAKLMHGSGKALQAVFDKYGATPFAGYSFGTHVDMLATDDESPTDTILEKLQALDRQGIRMPNNRAEALASLIPVIKKKNVRVLMALLSYQPQGQLPASLPLALLDCVSDVGNPANRDRLRQMCERKPELKQAVIDCLIAALPDYRKTARDLYLDDAPYFLEPLFEAALLQYGSTLRDAVWRHLNRMAVKSEAVVVLDKNNFLSDPARSLQDWITNYALYWKDLNFAAELVSAARAAQLPVEPALERLKSTGLADRQDIRKFLQKQGIPTERD